MKIRILKSVLVEVENRRLGETMDHYLNKWDELNVENINVAGRFSHLTDWDGNVYLHVPLDAFEVVKS